MEINHALLIHAFAAHRIDDAWQVVPHHHNIPELFCCVGGSVLYQVGRERHLLQAGDWLLIRPGCRHSLEKPANGTLTCFVFHFHLDDALFPAMPQHAGSIHLRAEEGAPRPEAARLQREVMALSDEMGLLHPKEAEGMPVPPRSSRFRLEGLLLMCIGEVCARLEAEPALPATGDRPADRDMEQLQGGSTHRVALANEIATRLERDLSGKGGIAGISRELNISRSTCARAFAAHFGESPQAYMAGLRYARARALLLETSDSIQSIADRLGFRAAEAFSRQFARWSGTSPTQFRRHAGGNRPEAMP